jgi:predicted ferric reductase
MSKRIGIIIILILVISPIAVWAIMMPLSLRFSDLDTAATSIGQILGLAGIMLFSINLILTSRLKIFDKIFWGINKLYDYHRLIGALAFSMILFHPLFLVVKYLRFSLRDAAVFLVSFGPLNVLFGRIALYLMILLMVFTFYIAFKYQNWKLTHKFMVLVFVFALLHLLYIQSDVSRNNLLRYYIIFFAIFGLLSGFWRAFLSRFINKNYSYRVKSVKRVGEQVLAIDMVPLKESIKFNPGQFIFLSFKSKKISPEVHPFSISSAPGSDGIQVSVKSLGDYTADLKNIAPGDLASIEGPFGKFCYNYIPNNRQIWMAGGIGITPFLSMARSIKDNSCKIDLYYCIKNKGEAVFAEELSAISSKYSGFRLFVWCSDERGFISAGAVSKYSNNLSGKDIFICGPPVFMKSLKDQFAKSGVESKKIHWELFELR